MAIAVAPLGGCGADEEPAAPPSRGTAGSSSSTGPERSTESSTSDGTSTGEDGGGRSGEDSGRAGGGRSGEDDDGGAGDEQPIGSEVRLTARDGRLTPRRIRVAPFIAVRLELRSRDRRRYRVRVGGQTLEAGGEDDRARVTLDGLVPDRSYAVRGLDGLNDARIVASGEPGG